MANLSVSRIMVKRTNLPRSGTTNDVGGMISASSKKNTVSDSRIEIDRLTCEENIFFFSIHCRVVYNRDYFSW